MANSVTKFDAEESVCRAGFNRRIDEVNNAFEKADSATAEVKKLVIGKNCLHNWLFVNPVNRKGGKVYSKGKSGVFIDRWRKSSTSEITLKEEGIVFTADSAVSSFYQVVSDIEKLRGKTVTISLLVKSSTEPKVCIFSTVGKTVATVCGKTVSFSDAGEMNLLTATGVIPAKCEKLTFECFPSAKDAKYCANTTVIAAKLELGGEQTLAHRDSSGEWVLNEACDFAEQMAICGQYDDNGDYIGLNCEALGAFSQNEVINTNLLHNWYFADPVNRKGANVYTQNSAPIFIDRWVKNGALEATLTDEGIVISASSNAVVSFYQWVEGAKLLAGKTVTASVLLHSSTKPKMTFYYFDAEGQHLLGQATDSFSDEKGILSVTADVPAGTTNMTVQFIPSTEGTDKCAETVFIAAKLEVGSRQTLAMKNPSGEWILKEVIDRAAQEAVCAQYDVNLSPSRDTNNFVGAAKPFSTVQNMTKSFELTAGMMQSIITVFSANDCTVTVPTNSNMAVPIGSEVEICRYSTGKVTVAGESGVVIFSVNGSLSVKNTYGTVKLKKLAADRWLLSGDL